MSGFIIDEYYINYAWGFQYKGQLITSDGLIYKYDLKDNPAKGEATLDDKIAAATLVGRFDPTRLNDLVARLSNSKIPIQLKTPNGYALDAGGHTYNLYPNDGETAITLASYGNRPQSNVNPLANELVTLINTINKI